LARIRAVGLVVLYLSVTAGVHAAWQPAPPAEEAADHPPSDIEIVVDAAVRLPVAAGLGALLAFRPRRRGTPHRSPPVIQTQILLAVVGALVMMVVGSSLARAFGIVGAAGLIRYRAKITDPKDAGVMLATLGVGLASGVGLYWLAAFATAFFLILLGAVESLDDRRREFELTIKAAHAASLRPRIEKLLGRLKVDFQLHGASEEEVVYSVRMPFDRTTERVSTAIERVAPGAVTAVSWDERKAKP
jgi:uncharacterized membrane protein YhiD involved in acid resistance